MESDKQHFQHILLFYYRKGKNALQARKKLTDVYGGESKCGMDMKARNDGLVTRSERYKANARERVRTCSVNTAFTTLRNLIPTDPEDRKLSKIETVKLACSYISHLGSIVMTGSCEISKTTGTVTMDFAKKSSICTFCVRSAKLKTD